MSRSFPRNCWYVAATTDEVGPGLSRHVVAGEEIVMRRQADGTIVALADRCAHRGYPLSAGHTDGDLIVCGYHGFCFDGAGTCVRVPSQPNPPYGNGVRSFPVREEGPFVWVWPGEIGPSRLQAPPRLPWLSGDGWASSGTVVDVAANYLLIHDHYLDLTHVPAMHPEMLGPGLLALSAIDNVTMSEMSVSLVRTLPPAPLLGWECFVTGLDDHRDYDRRHHGDFLSPAVVVEGWVVDPGDGSPFHQVRVQAVTPESEDRTRMYWRVARNYALDQPEAGQRLEQVLGGLMRQDVQLIEQVYANTAGRPGAHLRVSADAAMLKARQIVVNMLRREETPVPAAVSPLAR